MICHFITSEYPPQPGGVSDYTKMVAEALGSAGDEVHVWCPSIMSGLLSPLTLGEGRGVRVLGAEKRKDRKGLTAPLVPHPKPLPMGEGVRNDLPRQLTEAGVTVHPELGRFTRSDLRRVGRKLDQFEPPRRLLVQWVPHGYGYRAMNLHFCLWLWRRARRGDRIELIVHEPFLSFGEGSWRQDCVAVVHRLMAMVLLNSASRVWTAIPAWEKYLRPYAFGRRIEFQWLPVASNIPFVDDEASMRVIRSRYAGASAEGSIVGHFGTYDHHIADFLLRSIPALLQNGRQPSVLLLGRGSKLMRDELIRQHPEIMDRVHATGELNTAELSKHLSACDLMIQPYPDGVSSRRTTIMAQLSLGLPVITTAGNLTEPLWAESQAVALTPAGDVLRMVEVTHRLLGDEAERKRLAAAARSLYLGLFDIGRTVAALRTPSVTLSAE